MRDKKVFQLLLKQFLTEPETRCDVFDADGAGREKASAQPVGQNIIQRVSEPVKNKQLKNFFIRVIYTPL